MKARIYQFLIILLYFVCGSLVGKKEWDFITEFIFMIPFLGLGAILFVLYDYEIKKQ